MEAEFKDNPIMRKKSVDDILAALPNLQLIDSVNIFFFNFKF